jgi:hypothetical protein
MADPGNIGIVHSNNPTPIYFYTHFDGRYVTRLLAEGLKRSLDADRLHDESYATRIVFDTLTGCTGGTTSYGIYIGEPLWSESPIPIPIVSWEGHPLEDPDVIYEGRKFSALDFIAEYLATPEIMAEPTKNDQTETEPKKGGES